MDASLVPDTIVSASDCICPRFPETSALNSVEATEDVCAEALDAVDLPAGRRRAARSWATASFGVAFGWPGVFFAASDAIEARRRFFGDESKVRVVGLGLPRYWLEEFVAEASESRVASEGESGYVQAVERMDALAPGSRRLGFELLNVEYGQVGHSWLCNGLEKHCADVLGVRPGANGLIERLDAAELCRNEIEREEVGAEPGLWLPWLLVEYA
jgi:hypothetical protein